MSRIDVKRTLRIARVEVAIEEKLVGDGAGLH
jgi:hypothetical protein